MFKIIEEKTASYPVAEEGKYLAFFARTLKHFFGQWLSGIDFVGCLWSWFPTCVAGVRPAIVCWAVEIHQIAHPDRVKHPYMSDDGNSPFP